MQKQGKKVWERWELNLCREGVLERLRFSKGKRVVAIFSPVGYVGLDVFVHHLINCCGGKDPNLTIQKVYKINKSVFFKGIL